MSKKEIFVDPFIIDKIKNQNSNPVYLDIGSQEELKKLLSDRSDIRKTLLKRIYNKAESILSTSQFHVFVAVFKHGYKIPALARVHKIKRSTYYTHYYRALEKLRKSLVDDEHVTKKNMKEARIREIKSRNWRPF